MPIIYSIWTNSTLAAWEQSGCNKIYNDKKVKKYGAGTIVACVNSETKSIFGVGILGSPFVENANTQPYEGAAEKYNAYQADLQQFRKFAAPLSFDAINRICGIQERVKYNSYTKNVWASYVKLRYTPDTNSEGPDEATVAQRFQELVMTWI